MATEKLTLVNVEGPLKKVNKTLMRCSESGYFKINPPPDISGSQLKARNLRDRGIYGRMVKRCTAIAEQLGIILDKNATYENIEYNVSVDFKDYFDEIDKTASQILEEKRSLEASVRTHGAIYRNLEQLTDFKAGFGELLACEYIKMRFGRIPINNIRKLDYYSERPFLFFRFKSDRNYAWCIYLAPELQSEEIDYLFKSLGFQRVHLPEYLSGSPEEAAEKLLDEIRIETEKIELLDRKIVEIAEREKEKLSQTYMKLTALDSSYELRTNVLIIDNRFHFSGYIPARKKKAFQEIFEEIGDIEVASFADDREKGKDRRHWLGHFSWLK